MWDRYDPRNCQRVSSDDRPVTLTDGGRDRLESNRYERHRRIRIDAKRQALDGLDNLRRASDTANGNGKPANGLEIETIVEVACHRTFKCGH